MTLDEVLEDLHKVKSRYGGDMTVYFSYVEDDKSYEYQLNDLNGLGHSFGYSMTIFLDKREF